MGFMGFGKPDDKILDLKPKEIKDEIKRLDILDQKISIDLDKTNASIDRNMQDGSKPGLKDHEREKFALRVVSLNRSRKRFRSQLTDGRKTVGAIQVLFEILEKSRFYESKVQKKINELDSEEMRKKLEILAIAKANRDENYADIMTTGDIFLDSDDQELDQETRDVITEMEKNSHDN